MCKRCLPIALLLLILLVSGLPGCAPGEADDTAGTGTSASDDPSTTSTAESTTTTTLPPATWKPLETAGDLPSACLGAALVCVPGDARFLLFGGWTGGAVYSNTTWAYDPATELWSNLDPTGISPAPRAIHTLVFEPAGRKAILFGGFDGASYYNDTWAYDPVANTWTNLRPTGSIPAARGGHSLVYDPVSERLVLFGGWNGRTQYNDTWAYDPVGNTWTNLRPAGRTPVARDSQAMAYDPTGKVIILFGGWSATAEFQDTWAYDAAANTWTELSPDGEVPSTRALQQMVYDPRVERLVLFGGGSSTSVFDDTWHYDQAANTWSNANLDGSPPAARTGYALAYDSSAGRVVLFGGTSGSSFFNDLWVLMR